VRLTRKQRERVAAIWTATENATDYDLSTETLFAVVAERAAKELGVEVDAGDVADAIKPEVGGP
jgi:hypothetical protein